MNLAGEGETGLDLTGAARPSTCEISRFALFCKTFSGDLDRFGQLLESVERYASSELRLFISIPRNEHRLFLDRFGSGRFECLFDEELSPTRSKRGWQKQQLVKLGAHRANFADAWFWFDSDTYFVRSFSAKDFIRDGEVATIASRTRHVLDDNEAVLLSYLEDPTCLPKLEPEVARWKATGYRPMSPARARWQRVKDHIVKPKVDATIPRIAAFFGRPGTAVEFMPCSVWTRESLQSLEQYLDSRYGWTFEDMISFAPWEAVWVGEWEFFRGAPGRRFIESPMLHIREDATILRVRGMGVTEAKVANAYLGIQLAARHQSIPRLDLD